MGDGPATEPCDADTDGKPDDEGPETDPDDGSPRGGSASAASTARQGGRPCPRCERPMYRRHCKYVCPEHGVVFDCADTFY